MTMNTEIEKRANEEARHGNRDALEAMTARAEAAEAREAKLREALEWFEKQRMDAIRRADAIHAKEDGEVLALCKRHGFGAVMDSAARQWARLPECKTGAFFIGGCIGDETARAALSEKGGEQ